MECRITVLCENTVDGLGVIGEHGFSAYVETPGQNILFDTGQGFGLINNSLRLKKELKNVSKVVLSHGHVDHTGGLLAFLGVKRACPVVAHPDIFTERFILLPKADGEEHPLAIGMPWPQAYLTTRGAKFEWSREFSEVAPGVFVTGEVPRKTLFEAGSPKLIVRRNGDWAQDLILDDFSLLLKTSKGLVIVLGCGHAGIVNILNHAIDRTGEKRIHAVLGGTHLGLCPEPQLDPTIEALGKFDIGILGVSHCTGQGPISRLKSEFGDRFAFASVGFVLEV